MATVSATSSVLSHIATAVTSSATASVTPVPPQAGILVGASPTVYSAANPIVLFIIQVSALEKSQEYPTLTHSGLCCSAPCSGVLAF